MTTLLNSPDQTSANTMDGTPVTPEVIGAADNALAPISPRCAVMLLLDTSHTMYLGTALRDLHQSLHVFLGAIAQNAFRGASIDVAAVGMGDDLRMLDSFRPLAESRLAGLTIRPKGSSPLGGALRLALEGLDRQEARYRAAGQTVMTPQLFILTDGLSTDDCSAEVGEVQRRVAGGALSVHAIALGPRADRAVLAALAGGNVLNPLGVDMAGAFQAAGADFSMRYEKTTADAFRRRAASARVSGDYFQSHTFFIDGTNLIYWPAGDGVSLAPVLALARELKARGADYRVFFDASTRHKLRERGAPGEDTAYEELLRIRADRFREVPAGNEADAFLLMSAEPAPDAVVVSQDLFRDRAAIHPWIREPGRHLAGMMLDGELLFPDIGLRIPVGGVPAAA